MFYFFSFFFLVTPGLELKAQDQEFNRLESSTFSIPTTRGLAPLIRERQVFPTTYLAENGRTLTRLGTFNRLLPFVITYDLIIILCY
ncbi:hypothetical protein FA15DRAFT_167157 [Coprinopsis marcescibilis]|uniref:Uncharacterized protein n=1 Tax=Coprinopsis marcescibilis TaxID=230819 RepID=A0A5C3KUR9_COPMA|nr:hypothetical protein FA15DRAFT_167157 [Coprinopsis marcescibilis]